MRLPRAFFVYLLFSAIGFLILLTNIKIPSGRYLAWRNFFLHLVAPALWSAEEFARDQINLPANIVEIVKARRENVFLRKKILEYESALNLYKALVEENEFLRRVQGLSKDYWVAGYKVVVAEMVSRDSSGWLLGCTVNAGRRQGVRKNSAVVIPVPLNYRSNLEYAEGYNVMASSIATGVAPTKFFVDTVGNRPGRFILAGKITEVFDEVSEVMFVTNPMFAVQALIPSSGCEGLLEYFSGDMLVLNYPSKASAPLGADVVVSDSSRVFPPRIYIGNVVSNNRLSGGIKVSPAFLTLPLDNFAILVRK